MDDANHLQHDVTLDTFLDEQHDFVFTLSMAPTPVRLRLLARTGSNRQYLIVRNR